MSQAVAHYYCHRTHTKLLPSSFQFLTIIGLAVAQTSMVLGLLADLTLSQTLFNAKNIVSVCSTPLEVLISILYWTISLIDKRLLFPEELQLPFLPDFGFHAMPAIMLTLDLLLFSPPWTIKFEGAVALSTVLAFGYWGWIEYCFAHNQTQVIFASLFTCTPCLYLLTMLQVSVSHLYSSHHPAESGTIHSLRHHVCCEHHGVEVALWEDQWH